MGLIRDIAGAALAPATGGASLAMTGQRKKRGESMPYEYGETPGGESLKRTGSDDDSSGAGDYSPKRILKRVGQRLAKGAGR